MLSTFQADQMRQANSSSRRLKRAFDILVSGLGLLLLSPFFAWVAWKIKRDSPGPVFYRGERIGRNARRFKILKFRTMHAEATRLDGPKLTAQDDPRVTPYGRWLRDTKINELPQLWNVLKGEMSLVGPRPEDPLFADTWPREARLEVLSMRPGITSPASVLYRDEESLLHSSRLEDTYLGEILPSKLRLDQLYVRYHTFWGDLDVIMQTLLGILPLLHDKEISEPSLFAGPLTRLAERYLHWFFLDLWVCLIAIGMAGLLWRSLGPLHIGWSLALAIAVMFATLFSITNWLLKINAIEWSKANASDAFDLLPGFLVSLLAALLINNLLPPSWIGLAELSELPAGQVTPGIVNPWGNRSLLPNGMLIVSAGLAVVGFLVVRYRTRLVTGFGSRWMAWRGASGRGLERVLIVGCGDTGQMASLMLQKGKYAQSLQVVGFVDDSLHIQDSRVHGLNVLGRRDDILDLVKELDIGIIVFAIHNISKEERRSLFEICYASKARIFDFPDIPNTLHQISLSNGRRSGARGTGKDDHPKQPVSPERIPSTEKDLENWLARLEQLAKSGDISGTVDEIQDMRSALNYKAGLNKNSQETTQE